MCSDTAIEIEDARTHNLRGVTCRVPHHAMTVVTGVSGSGKSSLAFDTIYAEGQRRYVETLSTYARQFLAQMRRPPVRAVRSVPPALALRQGNSVSNARSTVATVTELSDHLQLLYAGAGQTFCVGCGALVERFTVRRVIEVLVAEAPGERIVVLGTVRPLEGEPVAELLRALVADGYRRAYVDGSVVDIDSPDVLDVLRDGVVRVVLDRLAVDVESSRLSEALEAGLTIGDGALDVVLWDRDRTERRFYDSLRCTTCGTQHPALVPALFDTNSRWGACGSCGGSGRSVGFDPGLIVPDGTLSLEKGAVAPLRGASMRRSRDAMLSACVTAGIDVAQRWTLLPESARRAVFDGVGRFEGVYATLTALEPDRYKPAVAALLARYRGYTECRDCGGSGLSANARAVRVGGADLGTVMGLPVDRVSEWLRGLGLPEKLAVALDPLLREIRSRLDFLVDAGVGYLTLSRQSRTLSGGEMHRVLLATSVGRMLTDACYVLDEPTAGLHPHDTARLMRLVERLRDIGNTVIVVEHDPDVIRRADHILELGPLGGDLGGELLYEGGVAGLEASATPTGESMRARRRAPVAPSEYDKFVTLSSVTIHNLVDVSVSFPLGALSVVTGVSGSGKSSLVNDGLWGALMERRAVATERPSGASVAGDEFDEVVLVDQSALPKSSRSNPLTLSGAYADVRGLFAAAPAAMARGFSPGTFSFNVPGGRCDRCDGSGVRTIEMHFMADVDLPCDVCDGRRFKPDVLAVEVAGLSIADVFELTVSRAIEVFAQNPPIRRALEPLARVGLGYLKMGQPTTAMSGGELQRLKLASFIGQSGRVPKRLFIFDEPTVGLHMRDVEQLLGAIRELVDGGATAVVVEHNLDFVAACDWLVDMGPGAGPAGGRVVYEGRPSGLAGCADSVTAGFLATVLADGPASDAPKSSASTSSAPRAKRARKSATAT
ncbi:MAG: excinuclease ABC subunit UvrA [Myxococcales bacterium]|nr:excinuclease ABC subunit UvrA [Myxococcales bacterium]MCB9533627.1 excinuclease ABC subunit UvrA [Myxococcales bacterium]